MITINLDDDLATKLVLEVLIDSYKLQTMFADEYSKTVRKHLKKVIRYYSDPDQWEEFKRGNSNAS